MLGCFSYRLETNTMKKFFYVGFSFLFLLACQAGKQAAHLNNAEEAHKVLSDYFLSDPQAGKAFPYLSQCKLAPAQPNPSQKNLDASKTYVCSVEHTDKQRYIAVVSVDPLLISEVDYYKRSATEFVYIALLYYDQDKKNLTGTKLLFNIYKNRVEKQTDVSAGS